MSTNQRLHALDAVRAFALLLGVVFHAGFSFIPGMPPGIWAMVDTSTSPVVSTLLFTSHIFRMTLFFFIAGFFARMMFHRHGARGFWIDRGKRILVPLVVGWIVLAPVMGVIWIWGLTKTFGGTLPAPPADMPPPPAAAFQFMHLWFLYYLLLLYVLVIGLRSAIVAIDRGGVIRHAMDRTVAGLVRTGAAALVLPIPAAIVLARHPAWIMWFGIPTPDQSLIPQVPSLLAYGTAVAFGWLVHRQMPLLTTWSRQWPVHLGAAAAATIVCLAIAGTAPALIPAQPGATTIAYAASYGVAIWCWTFGLIGLAMRFMARPNAIVRYVADSSYWIYLAHLPVVVALQVVVGHLPWHWTIKFPLVLAASLLVLFASYRYLVRSTLIGQVLNGRRYPRGISAAESGGTSRTATESAIVQASAAALSSSPETTAIEPADAAQPIAALRGVHKRYGRTVALAGLDLDVREGELLAVLGPNGAGKSTAISLLLGLLEPDEGFVQLLGASPHAIDTRRRVGVMMQDVALAPELTVRELIAQAASYYPNPPSVDETLALTRLGPLASRAYGKLSGGQKRQVQFAVAICGRPPVLFLDEPTVGLDVEAREMLWRTIRDLVSRGCSIVLTTHYLEEAEALADRVAVVAAGRLVASGTVADVRSLVSRKQIACRSALDVDDVRTWPGVVSATRDGDRLAITVVDAEDVVRRLLAADSAVRDLEVRQAGLAEAFTALTQEAA